MSKKNYSEARELLNEFFSDDLNTQNEMILKDEIMQFIHNNYKSNEEYEHFNIGVRVDDNLVINWKPKEHFTKIFYEEIKYIKNIYGLSKGERNLLNSLSPFLLWETNLLVDDETGKPLNQQSLAKATGVDRTTIYRNIEGLIKKKIICVINKDTNKYYLVNPFVMYAGSKINKKIVKLFQIIGYVDRDTYEKQKANNG